MSEGSPGAGSSLTLEARTSMREVFIRHLHAAVSTLGKSFREPVRTLTCVMGITIALALPSILFLMLDLVPIDRSGSGSVSIYLEPSQDDASAAQLGNQLKLDDRITSVKVFTKNQALAEYELLSGLSNLNDVFGVDNPLPAVVVVNPEAQHSHGQAHEQLLTSLATLPGVELVESDVIWLHRLDAFRTVLLRIVLGVGGVFGLGVVLIVASAIRLNIQEQKQHIELAKLIGATDAFVRRPFLYIGLWYGLAGALLALLVVGASIFTLREPIKLLAVSYDNQLGVPHLSLSMSLVVLATGVILGVVGAGVAITMHLRDAEPQ